MPAANRAARRAAGPKAERIFISMAKVKAGPPKPHQRWNFESIKTLLQAAKIDVLEVVNWTKAPDGIGYYIYYHGEAATERQQITLH